MRMLPRGGEGRGGYILYGVYPAVRIYTVNDEMKWTIIRDVEFNQRASFNLFLPSWK